MFQLFDIGYEGSHLFLDFTGNQLFIKHINMHTHSQGIQFSTFLYSATRKWWDITGDLKRF